MEALGAAGSIVGILGFIGQSVDGIAKLQKFFDNYKQAPHLAKKLRRETTSLEATLMDVKAVAQHLERQSWGDIAPAVKTNITNLSDFAKHCSDDIASWVQVTAGLDSKRKSGFRAFFRKVKLAMSGPDTLRSFEADVTKHRQNISNSLATLTVSLVIKGHMSIGELSSKLELFSDAQRNASKAILDRLGQTAVASDDSISGPVIQLLQNVQVSLEDRLDALSDVMSVMSIERGQRDQEIRSLYASSQASAAYMTPVSGNPVHGSPQHWPWRRPEYHRPSSNAGSFDMASLCSSLSSIAASLSALPGHYNHAHSGLQHTNDSPIQWKGNPSASAAFEWTCDTLSGIDDARYPSDEDPQIELCLFCGKGFMMKTLDDPYLFGKHLVYEHSFGKCDLNESFGSWEEFQDHLTKFHRACNFEVTDTTCRGASDWLHFRRRVSASSSDHPYFFDAAGVSKDLDMYEKYAKETDLRLQTELLQLLVEAGILEPRDLANPSFRPDLTCAIKTLNVICRTPATSDEKEARTKRSQKAAMIEEQLIVAGYNSAIQARMCPDFRHLYRELRDGSVLPRNQQTPIRGVRDRDNSNNNTFFSCVWTMTDARGRYGGGSLDQEPSHICSWCGDKVLPLAARTHIRHTDDGPVHAALFNERFMVSCERQPASRVVAVPRGLRAVLLSMQEHCGGTLAHRVSMWLLVCFLESASQRELLRTSSLTAVAHPPSREKGGGDGADKSWVVPILRFWNRDGLPIANTDQSNKDHGDGCSGLGAQDGAGLWSSSLAMHPAAAKPVEPVLTAMDRVRGPSIPISALLSPEEEQDGDNDDDGAGRRSASPNSAIWSQGDEPRRINELGKRAASPSPLFEFTGGAKRVKI